MAYNKDFYEEYDSNVCGAAPDTLGLLIFYILLVHSGILEERIQYIIDRPGVAWAVLQTTSSFIN